MSFATGGKVWAIPTPDSSTGLYPPPSLPHYNKVGKATLIMLAFWLLGIGIASFINLHTVEFEVKEIPVVGNAYNKEFIVHKDWLVIVSSLIFGVAMIFAGLFMVRRIKHVGSGVILNFVQMVPLLIVFLVVVIGASLYVGSANERPSPFADWAKEKHGYASIELVENSEERVYDAVKVNGEHVRVKEYQDGSARYLYENAEQLRTILNEITEKKVSEELGGES